jgi:hypothetical protein
VAPVAAGLVLQEAFKFNPETHLTPVLATSIKAYVCLCL